MKALKSEPTELKLSSWPTSVVALEDDDFVSEKWSLNKSEVLFVIEESFSLSSFGSSDVGFSTLDIFCRYSLSSESDSVFSEPNESKDFVKLWSFKTVL